MPARVEPIDIGAALGGLGPEIAEYGFEDFRFFDERSGVFDANWKLIHDTFTETYHVFSLHRDTLAPDMLSTPFVGDVFGANTRGVVMRKEVMRLLEQDESEWELRPYASIVYLVFPSVILNLPMSGHAELWEIYPEPEDPHRTRASVKFYVPAARDTDAEREFWAANVRFTHRVVFDRGLRPAAGHSPVAAQRPDARGPVRAQRARTDPPPPADRARAERGGVGTPGLTRSRRRSLPG